MLGDLAVIGTFRAAARNGFATPPSPNVRYFRFGRAREAQAFVFMPDERELIIGSMSSRAACRRRNDAVGGHRQFRVRNSGGSQLTGARGPCSSRCATVAGTALRSFREERIFGSFLMAKVFHYDSVQAQMPSEVGT